MPHHSAACSHGGHSPAHVHDHEPHHDPGGHGHGDHGHGDHDHGDHDHDDHDHGEVAAGGCTTASDRPAGHGHGHGHHHHHHHLEGSGRAFAIAVVLNTLFAGVEVVAGLWAGSMALVADAAHNLGDSIGLVLAWGAAVLARSKPSVRRTWGLRRSTILAALGNALLIFAGVGAVAWEAVERLRQPEPVQGQAMMVVAAIGVVINTGTALLFRRNKDHDVNVRGAYLHLVSDAAVSLGVVAAGFVVLRTGLMWVDPAVSLAVAAVIFVSTWSLLREALDLALDAVPSHIDAEEVRRYLEGLPRVRSVHELHVWPTSTTETALTAHLRLDGAAPSASLLREATKELRSRFRIHHVTLQLEPDEPGP